MSKKPLEIKIITYHNSYSETEAGDLVNFAKKASQPGRFCTVVELEHELAERGCADVVYEAEREATEEELTAAVSAHFDHLYSLLGPTLADDQED